MAGSAAAATSMLARATCCSAPFSLPSSLLLQRLRLDAAAAKKQLFLFTKAASSRRSAAVATAAVASSALHDAGAAVLCVAGAYTLVRTFDTLTESKIIEKSLSRKAVHVLSGLLYMSSWPFFSSSTEARYFAAIVPLLNCIRLIIYGSGLATDGGIIKSVSREGKAEELLRGPLYYVLVLLFCAIVFWRESPVGIISLTMMSCGDGFADIVGRRYGTTKLPYNQHKSWIGTISMFTFGFAFSIGMLYYFSHFGCLHFDWGPTIRRVALVSLASTLVESLPIGHVIDDNISVPFTSMVTAILLFEYFPH